ARRRGGAVPPRVDPHGRRAPAARHLPRPHRRRPHPAGGLTRRPGPRPAVALDAVRPSCADRYGGVDGGVGAGVVVGVVVGGVGGVVVGVVVGTVVGAAVVVVAAGPFETISVIVASGSTVAPAPGWVSMTSPAATMSSLRRCSATVK